MKQKIGVDKIEKAIEKILSEDFSGVKIIKVNVSDDVDFDGDNILRVDVIFEGKQAEIKPNFMSRAIRTIRPKLSDMDVFAFPMMSFISAKDAGLAAR
ncbi:hypothetical protein ACRYWZ_15695 [Agrobacterium deltaense]|uniref:hypothetical protein n=1 Tax=Agrobacterium deltaense TaxID=1183412 RepID=UPI003D97D1C5